MPRRRDRDRGLKAVEDTIKAMPGKEALEGDAAEPGDYPVDTEQRRNVDLILRVNGFASIRTELGTAVQALRAVPPDAIEAVIDFIEHQRNRSEIKNSAGKHDVTDTMDAELRTFEAMLKWRIELEDLDAKTRARTELRR